MGHGGIHGGIVWIFHTERHFLLTAKMKINLFYIEQDAEWQAWVDVEGNPRNGVCLGTVATKPEALFQASLELSRELNTVRQLMLNQDDNQPTSRNVETIRSIETRTKHFKNWGGDK